MNDYKKYGAIFMWKMHTLAYVNPVVVSLATCGVTNGVACLVASNDEWLYKKYGAIIMWKFGES